MKRLRAVAVGIRPSMDCPARFSGRRRLTPLRRSGEAVLLVRQAEGIRVARRFNSGGLLSERRTAVGSEPLVAHPTRPAPA